MKSGMLKLLCWMTLSIATLMANAAPTTEVVPLGYNMAENIIPAIQPMLQSNERVSAYGNQLLIRAEPQRIDEIKALVAQLDTQPSRLMISVANSGSSSGSTSRQVPRMGPDPLPPIRRLDSHVASLANSNAPPLCRAT